MPNTGRQLGRLGAWFNPRYSSNEPTEFVVQAESLGFGTAWLASRSAPTSTTPYRPAGTCLVLTQRIDHIDAIVARLIALGDVPLVLRGGLGSKALAAVADAITARQPGSGIVLVATGSYLGEGFDWPELDTLFLAFPLAFKGRVVQYVGRLLRTHAGKLHVELHDYVDVRIPVLDRMHAGKALPYWNWNDPLVTYI